MLWSPPAVCGTVHDAPAAVRWFSRLLFFRLPLADEVADFAAAIAWLRRRWLWVAAGYLVYVALLVVPGLLRERGGWYTAMAIIVPHLVLYLTAMMVAYSWVGYRINLGNLKQFLPKDGRPRRDKVRKLILIACISGVLGGVVGYMTGGSVKREGQAKGVWADAAQAFGQWNRDTFTPGTLTFIFLVMITGVSARSRASCSKPRPRASAWRASPPRASCGCCRRRSSRTFCTTRWPTCASSCKAAAPIRCG
jgi:hypothetical protein